MSKDNSFEQKLDQGVSRRDFLKLAGLLAGSTVLAACVPQVVDKIARQPQH